MITITADIDIPPATLARAFWALGSDEQVEFFAELAKAIKADGNGHAYSFGELQWFFVGGELLKPENYVAREMLMTMAAPLYLHTLEAVR